MYIMESQPASFHICEIQINGLKDFKDINGATCEIPRLANTWFIIPLEENIMIRIPDNTTQEIK